MNYHNQTLDNRRAVTFRALSFNHLMAAAVMAVLLALGVGQAHAQNAESKPTVQTVNINKANAQTMASALNGVGESRAEDIVRYREEFGPFTTKEQLTEVKGIGQSTLDRNRKVITLD